MKLRITKKHTIIKTACFILPVLSLIMSGCAKAPESTEIDGVRVAQSVNETNDQAENPDSGSQSASVREVLETFPRRVSWEFENGDNCLRIDAEVVIPDSISEVYTGKAETEVWPDERKNLIWDELLKEKMVAEGYPAEIYREDSLPPMVSLSYTDGELIGQKKSGVIPQKAEEASSGQENLFCSIFEKAGFQVKLEPNVFSGEPWNQYSYTLVQLWQNLPVASGFAATGTNEIVRTGGNVDLAEGKIISFDIANLLNITEQEKCEMLADADQLQHSLQKAVDAYEVIFSRGIKGVKIQLEYLARVQNQQIALLPVWRVSFDVDGYYRFLEDNPEERERLSMMDLCINAIDGSIAYGT